MNLLRASSIALLAIPLLTSLSPGMSPEDRQSYQQMLLLNTPQVPLFDAWVLRTHELPPDFDALPRNNALPDPLKFFSGKPVQNAADWKARRDEILSLYQQYAWGKMPPHAKFHHAEVQDTPGTGFKTRTGQIFAGPNGEAGIRVTLQIPDGPGPFPVVMGPGLVAGINRGRGVPTADTIRSHNYIVCGMSLSDGNDDSAKLAALYPDCDPGTLPRRGWAASSVVDYLLTLPEVDGKHIAITGYSRDGKAMSIGAALDERIAAVIAGSPGVGGILPFRLASEFNQAESIQSTTLMFPDWFHPRLRYFTGREDRLPIDGNLLLAAIAPRPFFLVAGFNDEVSNNWGDEQSFHNANAAYKLFGEDAEATGKLGILRVTGNHGANDWAQAMNWLDIQFGKSDKKWTNTWMFPWDYQQWVKTSGTTVDLAKFPDRANADLLAGIKTPADWQTKVADIKKNAQWLLGDPTPANPAPQLPPHGPQQDVPGWVIGRSVGPQAIPEFGWYAEDNANCATRNITFGNNVKGTLYYPKDAPVNAKLPTVIWLHSYSYPLGYMWVYHRELHPILALVDNGYAVLAYDQSGFGSRMDEASLPYQQMYPKWSQMGRLVADARSAVDTLSKDPQVNDRSIYLFGYGMGGSVAIFTGAMEPKVAGVVSIAGFTPMRTDTASTGTGGIARYSVDRPLMPLLGSFIGNESKIPVDYDELIASIAPRPTCIVNPLYDRGANFKDVHQSLINVRKVYALHNAEDTFKMDEPWDYDRLASFTQDRILVWMREHMK